MTAKTGVVMNGSVIEIENVFAGTDPIPAVPYSFDFWIYSSKNQNSAQDAGPWSVTTFLKIQGVNYVIDSGSSDKSFTAEVGNLAANGAIQVTNDITSGLDSIYSLNFIPNGAIEIGGKLIVTVPPTIVLQGSAVTSVGSCT